ncbi:hydrogenase expression/formation protein [Frateuria defendens]|uniref:hydrogenase expression/formation protein n=1 Tax=Frateuria defendens TaxID=2219559 RepID=UPI00066FE3E2|nr:hydrogenase expression/formation protein [Frateuria defendens]
MTTPYSKLKPLPIPVAVVGPGSQFEDEALQYMSMPQGMSTYQPPRLGAWHELPAASSARELLDRVFEALAAARESVLAGQAGAGVRVDLRACAAADRRLLDQLLGEGEVSARIEGPRTADIQETVFAGLWRVAVFEDGRLVEDYVEAACVPTLLRAVAARPLEPPASLDLTAAEVPPSVMNAPSILTELADVLRLRRADGPAHVVNLTLLPLSPEDIACLEQRLGRGPLTILSRGYGNCRVTSTAIPHCWRVVYYNSQDAIILDTIEVSAMPDAVCAAAEDLADSVGRFAEVLASSFGTD